jgi:hypothetical protein
MNTKQRVDKLFSSLILLTIWTIIFSIVHTYLYGFLLFLLSPDKYPYLNHWTTWLPLNIGLFKLWIILALPSFLLLGLVLKKIKVNVFLWTIIIDLLFNHVFFTLLYQGLESKINFVYYLLCLLSIIVSQFFGFVLITLLDRKKVNG